MSPVYYFIIAIQICFLISCLILFFTFWSYRLKIDIEKTSIYECGFTPYQSARVPLEIKFYLVSLLFIVFDVELILLFPLSLSGISYNYIDSMLITLFITFMVLGIFFEMRLKALDF